MISTKPLAFLAFALLIACSVTQTGRRRIAWFSEDYMTSLGAQAYDDATIGAYPLIQSGPDYDMIQRIGQRIAKASGKDYAWEFRLLHAPDQINAFCLPGGKVAVYSGLLPVTQNEDALAAVIGHEVAHATEEHGNERMTHGALQEIGMTVAEVAAEQFDDMSAEEKGAMLSVLGVGANLGFVLPFSREHESEADHIGLIYLVRAGYDPNAAPALWERMAALQAEREPEFLSTHPDPLRRAEDLRRLIPEVVARERPGR